MNDEEIEARLRGASRVRPSQEFDRRMGTLFDAGTPRRVWVVPLSRSVPAWAVALACLCSLAGGFIANVLWQPCRTPEGAPASIAICMLDPDRPLARRFLGPARDEAPIRLSGCTIKVHATDEEKARQP